MPRCPVCGRTFDDLGYQVFLPGNAQPFDRLDCAHAYTGPPTVLVDPAEVDDEESPAGAVLVPPSLKRLALPAGGAALGAATLAAAGVFWLHPGAGTAEATHDVAERALPSREGLRSLRPSIEAGAPTATPTRRMRAKAPSRRITTARAQRSAPAELVSAPGATGPSAGAGSQPPPVSPPPPPPPPPAVPPSPAPGLVPAPAPVSTQEEPGESRPGWGHGDKNHEHTGPPGQAKKSAGGNRG